MYLVFIVGLRELIWIRRCLFVRRITVIFWQTAFRTLMSSNRREHKRRTEQKVEMRVRYNATNGVPVTGEGDGMAKLSIN